MGMANPEGIAPQETGEPVGGEEEGGGPALGSGIQFPIGMRSGVVHPRAKFDHAFGIGSVHRVGGCYRRDQRDEDDGNYQEAFRHGAGLYLLELGRTQYGDVIEIDNFTACVC